MMASDDAIISKEFIVDSVGIDSIWFFPATDFYEPRDTSLCGEEKHLHESTGKTCMPGSPTVEKQPIELSYVVLSCANLQEIAMNSSLQSSHGAQLWIHSTGGECRIHDPRIFSLLDCSSRCYDLLIKKITAPNKKIMTRHCVSIFTLTRHT